MRCRVKISRCSRKSLIWIVILFSLYLILLIFVDKYVNDFISDIRNIKIYHIKKHRNNAKHPVKHILLWQKDNLISQNIFLSKKCSITNCVFTNQFLDEPQYDAILFNENILESDNRPKMRSTNQLYIFCTLESSYNKPACTLNNDGFFNLTLTYRLDSDIMWSYFVVRNLTGDIIAPSSNPTWIVNSNPIPKRIKTVLSKKKKTAAWLVSHCKADSFRDEYLTRLQEHLFHFALRIDVYGKCSQNKCPNGNCENMLNDYYFYMAFENSFSTDYVTEKVLHGYDNYAVPVVYGGANYTRFLPPGSYINAREMHPYNLAFAMNKAIKDPSLYETYFKWTNLYTVESDARENHPLCTLCETLNVQPQAPAKEKFRLWWNEQNGMKWCLSPEYWNETSLVNIDPTHLFKLY